MDCSNQGQDIGKQGRAEFLKTLLSAGIILRTTVDDWERILLFIVEECDETTLIYQMIRAGRLRLIEEVL